MIKKLSVWLDSNQHLKLSQDTNYMFSTVSGWAATHRIQCDIHPFVLDELVG